MPRPDGKPWERKDITAANSTTLRKWLDSQARKPEAVRERMRIAVEFFHKTCRKSDRETLSELTCTDFSKPVRVMAIPTGTYLIGYKTPRSSRVGGSYFTRVGYGPQSLGIALTGQAHWLSDYTERDKEFRLFKVVYMVPQALESTCAPASDRWSLSDRRVLAAGGGVQYCFPDAYARLILVDHLTEKKTGTAVTPLRVWKSR